MRKATLIRGHVLDALRCIRSGSVQCIVTSPPYWGLRDYKLVPQVWGGEAGCVHEWGAPIQGMRMSGGTAASGLGRDAASKSNGMSQAAIVAQNGARRIEPTETFSCILCGAWRGSLGLEPTIVLYLAHLVEVFEECRRVLRSDGTLWLNIGDSYWSRPNGSIGKSGLQGSLAPHAENRRAHALRKNNGTDPVLKHKDACLIPFRLAIALQEAGWWVRSDIIWNKPAPMPESVRDRPTRAHEYIVLLTKSARYFYDAEAVREPDKGTDHPRSVLAGQLSLEPSNGLSAPHRGIRSPEGRNGAGRNLRSVWTMGPSPFPEAHFATFPPELAERCISAGTSEAGCCSSCGAPRVRVTDREFTPQADVSAEKAIRGRNGTKPHDSLSRRGGSVRGTTAVHTSGWEASCSCGAGTVPCVVLDPFGGAGTTAMVALRLGRRAVSIELSEEYHGMAQKRIRADATLLNQVAEARA